jgi:hypothetical protein
VSDPILIEVYEPERLRHRRDGYALVLIEERRAQRVPSSLEDVRPQVEKAYTQAHAQQLSAQVDADVLAGSAVPGPQR